MCEPAKRSPRFPLNKVLGTLAELADEGKIGRVALGEVGAETVQEDAFVVELTKEEVKGIHMILTSWNFAADTYHPTVLKMIISQVS